MVTAAFTDLAATFVDQSPSPLPPMEVGATANVTIRMRDTGLLDWPADTIRLQSIGQAVGIWSIDLVVTDPVGRNEIATISFTIRAPATPGGYHFQWQLVDPGGKRFGDLTPDTVVTVAEQAAVYVSQVIPTSIPAGTAAQVTIVLRNPGPLTWRKSSIKLQPTVSPATPWSLTAQLLATDVAPGSSTFEFAIKAPDPPNRGTYQVQWQLTEDGAAFGNVTPSATIAIAEPPVCEDKRTEIGQLTQSIPPLRREITVLQRELQTAAPTEKADLIADIHADQQAIAQAQARIETLKQEMVALGCN